MNTLLIRHVESGDPPKFQAICPQDARSTETVAIPSPVGFPVEGRPNSDLMRELRWYLEGFLDYPFPPETEHAERVRDALRRWGVEAFNKLFGDRRGGEIFNDATREGYESLHLLISSDDPQVLGWPWEALHDPQAGQLAQTCQIERRLNTVRKPDKVGQRWPKDQVNILLVTARPYEGDVRYRSISRPLVELIDKQDLPAQVTVLRPPTFENLREHLRERPNHYHIVHFDGHGSYGQAHAPSGGPHMLQGPEGQLDLRGRPGETRPDHGRATERPAPPAPHPGHRAQRLPVGDGRSGGERPVRLGRRGALEVGHPERGRDGLFALRQRGAGVPPRLLPRPVPHRRRGAGRALGPAADVRAEGPRLRGAGIRSTIGWSPSSISKSPSTSRSRRRPRRPRPTAVPSFQERPAIRRTPTASSAATGPCWRWSAPCTASRRGC